MASRFVVSFTVYEYDPIKEVRIESFGGIYLWEGVDSLNNLMDMVFLGCIVVIKSEDALVGEYVMLEDGWFKMDYTTKVTNFRNQ